MDKKQDGEEIGQFRIRTNKKTGDTLEDKYKGSLSIPNLSFLKSVQPILIMVALVLIVFMGITLYQRSIQLEEMGKRINSLESALSITDESLNQSDSQLKQELGNWQHEIRKLWDVSNKRNKKWIKDNEKSIQNLRKNSNELDKTLEKVVNSLKITSDKLNQQKKKLGALNQYKSEINAVVRRQREITDNVNSVEQKMLESRSDVKKIRSEFKSAIAAMDSHRLQINKKLSWLEKEVANINAKSQ